MTEHYEPLQRGVARTLALGGIGLIIGGLVLGEIYAIFISHVANGVIEAAWIDVINATVSHDAAALESAFDRIADLSERRGRFMNTHSHIGAYGLLALALAVIHPGYERHARLRVSALLLLCGAWVHITGTFAAYYLGAPALWIATMGQIAVIVALGGFALSFARGDTTLLVSGLPGAIDNPDSRRLLLAGLALIVCGMAFGLWFAYAVTQDLEPRMLGAMRTAVDTTAAGATETATAAIREFKGLQSKIAITAAAHSHAIEFGFLLLLLASLVSFVMLSPVWRARWTVCLIIGAGALPVCVFLATIYGLTAAVGADIAGGLVLIGLIAVLVGLVRFTGMIDRKATAT